MPAMADCDPTPAANQPPAGNKSGRIVHCVKFQKDLPGLDAPPWPGELGQRIYENVSAQAWKMWEDRMKMILNEYRLMPWQKEAQELIARHMEDFFFGQGAALPPGYVPQQITERSERPVVRTVRRSHDGNVTIDDEPQLRVRGPECLFDRERRQRASEDESKIAFPFRQWSQLRVRFRGDPHADDVRYAACFAFAFDAFVNATSGNRDHHHAGRAALAREGRHVLA